MDKILKTVLEYLKKDTRKQGEFLEYLGLSSSAVSDWKSGKSSSYLKYMPMIAEYFSVTVDMMINGYGTSYKDAPAPSKIPVISTLSKEGPCVTADNIIRYDCAYVRFSNEYFFFEDGDTLYLIHRQNYADDNDLVLIRTENGAFIRQYRQSGNFAVFISETKDGEILTVDDERASEFTAGVAVEARRKLN